MALTFHYFIAGKTEFYSGKAVDAVINTLLVGYITAGYAVVGSIDDGSAASVVISPCQRYRPFFRGVSPERFVIPLAAVSDAR